MFEIDKLKFGTFVAELRRQKGYTQKELAEKLYISDKAVSKWETGVSIPDVALLIPLADCLDVTVTELLHCRRMAAEPLQTQQVEDLVKTVITYSDHKAKRFDGHIGRRIILFTAAVLAASGEIWALFFSPFSLAALPVNLLTFEMLYLIFGAYFMFFTKVQLPWYYDQDRIGIYYDGPFRLNLPGVSFNNRNWPHVVKALRISLTVTMVLFPILFLGIAFIPQDWVAVQLVIQFAAVFGGLFGPVYYVAKKYE